MKRNQSGFTLIEIAIVLVIIGLLLGGVMKGQELINSAKVKNLAGDFKNIPVYIYGYQDKFRALPGDDGNVSSHLSGLGANSAVAATTTSGVVASGTIDGAWDSDQGGEESILFWQHVRLANLATGPTVQPSNTAAATAAFVPANAVGGRIGISSHSPISGMTGSYFICSSAIDGKFATQLDTTMDDGVTTTGSMRAIPLTTAPTTAAVAAVATTTGTTYTMCMSF